MPAPKRPNTAPATAALVRRGQETMAAKLREAGWTVTPPERTEMELNRKQINDEIRRIVRRHEVTIRTGDEESATVATGQMIRELQAHMDATVETVLAVEV
jgi:hypothetical protein